MSLHNTSAFIITTVILCCSWQVVRCSDRTKEFSRSSHLFSSNCGIQGVNLRRSPRSIPRIVGGVPAELGEFPWLAMIFYSNSEKHECGGVLISEQFLLTAAHCLTGLILNLAGQPSFVRLGEHDIRTNPDCDTFGYCASNPSDYKIKATYAYPKYNPRFQINDIGLIRLANEIYFTDFIHPICLPSDVETFADPNMPFTVAGWGKTETESFSSVKLKAQLPLFERCQDAYKTKSFGPDQICAGGEEGIDTCRGDSGGPLMLEVDQRWFVYGIVSHGPTKCGSRGLPGVYTNVSSYMTWIYRRVSMVMND